MTFFPLAKGRATIEGHYPAKNIHLPTKKTATTTATTTQVIKSPINIYLGTKSIPAKGDQQQQHFSSKRQHIHAQRQSPSTTATPVIK